MVTTRPMRCNIVCREHLAVFIASHIWDIGTTAPDPYDRHTKTLLRLPQHRYTRSDYILQTGIRGYLR
eukprot:2435713-Amphidinium_carterae.1